jgi:hypothetical protein
MGKKRIATGAEARVYIYLGDRYTRDDRRGVLCRAVVREDGRCIRGWNGSMLVQTVQGERLVVVGCRLRRVDPGLWPLGGDASGGEELTAEVGR